MCLNQTRIFKLIIKLCPFITLDPGGAGTTQDAPRDQNPEEIISRQLAEQSRFAYAAQCGVSLGQLFTGPENRYQSHVIMTCCVYLLSVPMQ